MAKLTLQDIFKQYDGGTQTVSNINLQVEDGHYRRDVPTTAGCHGRL
jgi:ABC-type sugar transport system ATPase subunit